MEFKNLMRLAGDTNALRNNELSNMRWGIGIGGSLIVAGMVGVATAATGGLFLVPLIVGTGVAGACMFDSTEISQEERLLKGISERLAKILEKSDEQ